MVVSQRMHGLLLDSGNIQETDWFSVTASRQAADGPIATVAYMYLAHQRWRGPKIALLTRAASFLLPDGSSKLELRHGAVLDHLTVYTLVRELLGGRADGVSFNAEKFGVQNFDAIRGDEPCGIRCVKTIVGQSESFKIYGSPRR